MTIRIEAPNTTDWASTLIAAKNLANSLNEPVDVVFRAGEANESSLVELGIVKSKYQITHHIGFVPLASDRLSSLSTVLSIDVREFNNNG